MKICSFNVNSVRARLENVLEWLRESDPDIALLQELKCQDEQFPKALFEDAGYNVITHGQKSWNGIAILSKFQIEDVVKNIPGYNDPFHHSRYLEAFTGGVRVASTYMPNGNPIGTAKFEYKLDWMRAMGDHFKTLLTYDEPIVIGGDYNVIPRDVDANLPAASLKTEACAQPEVREIFYDWQKLGWTDAMRFLKPDDIYYTYWDYFRGGFENNRGILLDFFFLNPKAKSMLKDAGVNKSIRERDKPSDHAPIWMVLDL
ncbi:MAG: exodeoxyribonuclease III [Alphaproteobacteria bacterium]|nr:exodeoxyribonuclease III [Alphaproteobacteria bacterium]MBN2779775.1 exodeoxyribonuclease III [Alphaproteobacteria bacterium]